MIEVDRVGGFASSISTVVKDNYAYVVDEERLHVFDISDPTNIVAAGSTTLTLTTGELVDLALLGDYVYVISNTLLLDPGLLEVFDVSNPSINPVSVGNLPLGAPTAITVSENFAYVVSDGREDDLKVIDISDPTAPSLRGSLAIGNDADAVAVRGNYVFTLSNNLKVIDVNDPNNPLLVNSIGVGGPIVINDLTVSSSFAYVIGDDLRVVRLACPDQVFSIDPFSNEITGTSADELVNSSIIPFRLNGFNINPTTSQLTLNSNKSSPTVDLSRVQKFGIIDTGVESTDQSTSNQAGNSFTTTPWVYTNAVEAQGERGTASTLITIGNDGTYGTDDEIHLVTDGESRMVVNADGTIDLNQGALTAGDISVGDISADDIRADEINVTRGNFTNLNSAVGNIGVINQGTQSNAQSNSNQSNKGYTVSPWIYSNALQAQNDRGSNGTLITVGNEGNFGANDEIHLITNGNSRLEVDNNGRTRIGNINKGGESFIQRGSPQSGNGFTVTPWVYTNVIEAQDERTDRTTQITIGNDGTYGTNDQIHLVTFGNSRLQVNADGRVGIGRNPTTRTLEVDGTASKATAGDWLANSDARLKKNMQQLNAETTLEKLLALQGITYEWDDDKTEYERPAGIQYGFTAQNIQEVFPTLVEEDAEGYLQTAYGTYDAMYVEAFRALLMRIENQQQLIETLQQKTTAINAENQQLQQQVARIKEVEATLDILQQQLNSPDHSTTTKK